MPASRIPFSPSSKPALGRGRSPREPSRYDCLVRASRGEARVAGLVMANVRSPPEQAQNGAGIDRHRAVAAWFRLLAPLPECGLVPPAGQANVGAANRHTCTLWVVDALAGDGGRNTRLLRARRSRSDPVLAGRSLAALRRAYRAIAVTVAAMSLALAAPFINVLSWLGGLRWLAAYGVAVALAMVAVALAVLLTVGLFRTIGPKRTRLGAQIAAAVIGASFAIGVQFGAILSFGTPSRVVFLQSEVLTRYAPDTASILWWPARAILGDLLALAVVFSISAVMLATTIATFAPRLGQMALATAGVSQN